MDFKLEPHSLQETPVSVNTQNLVVGRIPYLVCAPYFFNSLDGIDKVEFYDGSPSLLNKMLYHGKIDCAPSSCIEYARNSDDYMIIPNISTGGRGKIKSVLFLSQVPWEEISGKNVTLSQSSSTSNVLFQILCQRKFKVDPILNNEDHLIGQLAIGNEALKLSYHGHWKYCYDLAEEWYKWQELPFSFGLWIVRKESIKKKSDELRAFVRHLEESKEKFLSHPDDAIEKWIEKFPVNVPNHVVQAFFESADYQLTPRHEKSLLLFFQMAYEEGYSPKCRELHFLPDEYNSLKN